jgi:hypothetical protein
MKHYFMFGLSRVMRDWFTRRNFALLMYGHSGGLLLVGTVVWYGFGITIVLASERPAHKTTKKLGTRSLLTLLGTVALAYLSAIQSLLSPMTWAAGRQRRKRKRAMQLNSASANVNSDSLHLWPDWKYWAER